MSADKVGKAEMIIFTGNSHPELAELIASRVKSLGSCKVYKKSNKETAVDIKESVRGKDVFIIQTGTKEPNDNIMEILIMAYACKTSCARSLIGVLPYLPYSRQSKQKKRGAIVMKLFAKLLSKAGFCHLITVDLHQKEIQGFFDFPVDNLRAFPFLADYIEMKIPDYRNAVLVARHPSQAKRATAFASKLHLNLAVIHGSEDRDENDPSDGRNSPPPENSPNDSVTSPSPFSSEGREFRPKFRMDIVGDVSGRIAIIIEDIVDDVNTFIQAAAVLKEHGAYKVYVIATHGLLGADTPGLLESSPIDELVITNTIPHDVQKMQCHKIKTVDISQLLSEAIRRIHNQESMSYLFRDMTQD